MQTLTRPAPARMRRERPETANASVPALDRAPSAEPKGSGLVTAFYLIAALACLAVVVAAAVGAAL